ncbi:MAG: phage major capsid protein [Patescibacteria group bacterium]
MAVTDYGRLTAVTRDYVLPSVVHQLKKEMPFFGKLLAKAKKRSNGGVQIHVPVTYKFNTNGGSYAGLEVLDTDLQDTRTRAEYDWKQVYAPIVASNIELFKNGGKAGGVEAIVDMLKQDMEEAKETFKNNVATMLFADGTGNSSKDLLGLRALVDDGTDVTTLGDITFSSYTWWKSTVSSSVGSLTLAHMATQYSAASSGRGAESVDLILTTETVWDAYEALLLPNQRFSGSGPADGSYSKLMYRGAEVMADEYVQSQDLFFLNTRYLDLYVGDHPVHPTDKSGFTVTPMREPHDQDGQVGFILMYGQVCAKRPARCSKSKGVTA